MEFINLDIYCRLIAKCHLYVNYLCIQIMKQEVTFFLSRYILELEKRKAVTLCGVTVWYRTPRRRYKSFSAGPCAGGASEAMKFGNFYGYQEEM